MSVNHTHDEISQLIFLRGESFSRHSAASHASIMLEALVSGGLGKLWVTPRSASIYKTCLARVFLHSTGSWSVCALHFVLLLFSRSTREALGRGGVFGPPAAPRHGITTSLCCLVKGFFHPDQYPNWAVWSSIFQAFIQIRGTNTKYREVCKPESELCKSGATSFK